MKADTGEEPGTLALVVKRRRLTRGWSLRRLATAAGIPVGTVADIEAGRTKAPNLSTLTALGAALNITLDELAGRSGATERLPAEDEQAEAALLVDALIEFQALTPEQRRTALVLLRALRADGHLQSG